MGESETAMNNTAVEPANEFNRRVVDEFRANGGRVGGALADTPILLLHHIGARSGIARVTPLAYTQHGPNGFLIVASNGGSPAHPRWYYNLTAHPTTEIETGSETIAVRAEELVGDARAREWPALLAASPSLRAFDLQTTRQIPLVLLSRTDAESVRSGVVDDLEDFGELDVRTNAVELGHSRNELIIEELPCRVL